MRILAGSLKNRAIHVPKGEILRPTSARLRGALFNICQHIIEGARFLDLFAGSGAMGFEALSRGASYAAFVEQEPRCLQSIRRTVQELHLERQTGIHTGNVFNQLERMEKRSRPFSLIYADPPYELTVGRESASKLLLDFLEESPLLEPGGYLFIEDAHEVLSEPDEYPGWELINIRRLGRSHLHQYRKYEIE